MNFLITSGGRGARFELRDGVQPRKLRRDCRARRRRQLSGGLALKYLKGLQLCGAYLLLNLEIVKSYG